MFPPEPVHTESPAFKAYEAVDAKEAVPKSEPVIPPVTIREPVILVDCN
jgi:hypothetical protein